MMVLAADTSTQYCSVAVCECGNDGTHVLSESTVRAGRRHSEILLSTVRDLLNVARIGLSDVDLLAISSGPGSFTGVRVGIATWKGLAFGTGVPLIGVPTLAALARRIGARSGVLCPMLDARMQEVFAAAYEVLQGVRREIVPNIVAPVEDVLRRLPTGAIVFGEGALRYRREIERFGSDFYIVPAEFHAPSAASVALEGYSSYMQGTPPDPSEVVPIYLRKSQAEANRAPSEAPVA